MNHPKIDKENKLEIVDNVFLGRIDKELVGFFETARHERTLCGS